MYVVYREMKQCTFTITDEEQNENQATVNHQSVVISAIDWLIGLQETSVYLRSTVMQVVDQMENALDKNSQRLKLGPKHQ